MNKNIFILKLVGGILATHVLILLGVGFWSKVPSHASAIVVLGNKIELDGAPSVRLQHRLDRAGELFDQGVSGLVVVTGGIGESGHDESEVMRDYLVREHDVPSGQIILDNKGVDTMSSAENVGDLVLENNWESVLVVSHYYHILRTRYSFARHTEAKVYGTEARSGFSKRDIYSIPREMVGLWAYFARR